MEHLLEGEKKSISEPYQETFQVDKHKMRASFEP